MGSGSSSSSKFETHDPDTVKSGFPVPRSPGANDSKRSRTLEENGGKFDEDSVSVGSKDSEDTLVISARISHYLNGEEQDEENIDKDENATEQTKTDTSNIDNRGNTKVETLSQEDIIETIAASNCQDPKENDIYEIDTIGYYIAKGMSSKSNQKETDDIQEVEKMDNHDKKKLFNDNHEEKKLKNDNHVSDDKFETFKKIYTDIRPKSRKKSSVSNKQTLILAKVGTQFKYVAVPAYLPGQKLYKNAFAKPYIERADTLYKVKQQKGIELTSNSNTQSGTSRTHSGKIDGEKKVGTRMTKLPACSQTNTTPTFYIGGCNGVSLVEGPLTSLGWKRITDKNDRKFKLKWVESKARIDYQALKEGEQLVNHLPNSQLLTNKMGLLNSLKEYERVTLSTKGRLPRLRMSDFHPETYKLDEKSDREMFLDVYKEDEIWICKPTGWNQGKGIFLIRSRETVKEVLEEQEQKKQQPKMAVSRIVQRYITNPLLLDGRKFDVRAYMLIASTVPFLILYHKGYVRLCCHKYDADTTDLGIHLTNQYVQKKDPSYEKLKETTAWSMDKFNAYINEEVRPDCPVEIEEDWVYNTFTRQVQKIMIHLFNSVKHKLESKKGYFDLFGLDFMVDSNMKVQLIEVNTNPALACNCKALKQVIPGVVEESLYLAIECLEKSKKNQPLMPLKSLKNFTVLYCGSNCNTSSPSRNTQQMKEDKNAENKKLLPNHQAQHSLTRNTPIHATNQQREAEKAKSASISVASSKEISATRSHDDPNSSQTSSKLKRNVRFNDSGMNEKTRELRTSEKNHTKNRQDTSRNNEKNLSESKSEKDKNMSKENERVNDLNKVALPPGQSLQNELQPKMTQTEDLRSATRPYSRQSMRTQDKLQRGN